MYCLEQFWRLQIPICEVFYTFSPSLLSIFQVCSKTWTLIKFNCFAISRFSLCSFWCNKFLKAFSLLQLSTLLHFQRSSLLFDDLCEVPLTFPLWIFPLSFSLFVRYFPFFKIYYVKKVLLDSRDLKIILV